MSIYLNVVRKETAIHMKDTKVGWSFVGCIVCTGVVTILIASFRPTVSQVGGNYPNTPQRLMKLTTHEKDVLDMFNMTMALTLDDTYTHAEKMEIMNFYESLADESQLIDESVWEAERKEAADLASVSISSVSIQTTLPKKTSLYDDEMARRFARYAAAAYCKKRYVKDWTCGVRCRGRTQGTTVSQTLMWL